MQSEDLDKYHVTGNDVQSKFISLQDMRLIEKLDSMYKIALLEHKVALLETEIHKGRAALSLNSIPKKEENTNNARKVLDELKKIICKKYSIINQDGWSYDDETGEIKEQC